MRITSALTAVAVVLAGLVAGVGSSSAAGSSAAGSSAAGSSAAGSSAAGSSAAGSSAAGSSAAGSSSAAAYCGITWGSAERSAGALSDAPLTEVRTGRHDCYDRVVFEFAGPVDGYAVGYGETWTEGEGLALSPYTAGGALLRVSLRAPAYDDARQGTVPYAVGEHIANLLRYPTVRDIVFGGSFEGYSTFAVGVRARLPFRVLVLTGPGTHSRIVLDVAHQW